MHIVASDIYDKFSISTQLFLQERDGKLSLDPQKNALERLDEQLDLAWRRPYMDEQQRTIASPSIINGVECISAFIQLNDNSDVSVLRRLGVEVQCRFDGGVVTAEIPVDAIESVASLGAVQRIDVAELMQKSSDVARQTTRVLPTLANDLESLSLGILSPYDGTGVILGVIDTGIDFQHIAFKDKDGNYRIKRAYIYNGTTETDYDSSNINLATTDDDTGDHGTHTSALAGGSSVIISGNTVTVTDNPSLATYGGMAPGTDLYLAGIRDLKTTYLANAFQKICTYADQQGQPVVVSNSWGSQAGPHNGTGYFANITSQYFGDAHPGHICLFASANDAGNGNGEGTGFHVFKDNVSSANPLNTVLYSHRYSNTTDGYCYAKTIFNAWARNINTTALTLKIMVLDASTGAVLTSTTVNPTTGGTNVTGLSSYYDGTLTAYKDHTSSELTEIMLYSSEFKTKGRTYDSTNKFYTSKYVLAVQLYPSSGTSAIDAWGGNYSYFGNTPVNNNYNWLAGSDDCSVSDEAVNLNVISVGAYVTKNRITDHDGITHALSTGYTVGDIAPFSGYATAEACPTGQQHPWICAPGSSLVSAVNHYHTTNGYVDDYYASNGRYCVNGDLNNPYGNNEGTSMAAPVAAGIVALWLQAGLEAGKTMTTSYIKEVMQETAIHDTFTEGTNAIHFGQGKIDALAGIQYILGVTPAPIIQAPAPIVDFGRCELDQSYQQSLTIRAANLLDEPIAVSLSGSDAFSVSTNTLPATGGTFTVTYTPTANEIDTSTLTLTSGTTTSTVTLTGTPAAVTLRYKATADDDWHIFTPDASDVYALTDMYAFEVLEEVPNVDVSYTRNFKNTNYQSICLPFDVTITSELLQDFAVDAIYDNYATDTNHDGELDYFEIITEPLVEGDVMRANYPYLIAATAAQEMTIFSSGVTIQETSPVVLDCSSVKAAYTFCGTYSQMSKEDLNGLYVTSNGSLKHSSSSMNPFRWFMEITGRNGYAISATSQVSVRRIGDATHVDIHASDEIELPIYDLMGRPVSQSAGGIYIINGKKVYIK